MRAVLVIDCGSLSVDKTNSLSALRPEVAKEWHYKRNDTLKPDNVTVNSNKVVWWICAKDNKHEWKATISHRSNGVGCPFCSGHRASYSNNLTVTNPKLAKEWNYEKNFPEKPENYSSGSGKRVWWICTKDSSHIWDAVIASRNNGHGCPICSGHRPSKQNNLLAVFPEIAKEWHPTKNNDLSPEDFTSKSGAKVWWQCQLDKSHEWQAKIEIRTKGQLKCPECKS